MFPCAVRGYSYVCKQPYSEGFPPVPVALAVFLWVEERMHHAIIYAGRTGYEGWALGWGVLVPWSLSIWALFPCWRMGFPCKSHSPTPMDDPPGLLWAQGSPSGSQPRLLPRAMILGPAFPASPLCRYRKERGCESSVRGSTSE